MMRGSGAAATFFRFRPRSGGLEGPWIELEPPVKGDSGHGMVFRSFEGQRMMILHRPFRNARGKLHDMADRGDRLEIVRERIDLHGGEVPR